MALTMTQETKRALRKGTLTDVTSSWFNTARATRSREQAGRGCDRRLCPVEKTP